MEPSKCVLPFYTTIHYQWLRQWTTIFTCVRSPTLQISSRLQTLFLISEGGSSECLVPVQVQAEGLIDTGAHISIIGADLFLRVAAAAHLKKSDFKEPDKVPHSYDQRPFQLHSNIMLDITFLDKTLHTPVYVKMDAPDSLLLSEGVCRQLGIVSYHPSLSTDPAREASTVAQMQSESALCRQCVSHPLGVL